MGGYPGSLPAPPPPTSGKMEGIYSEWESRVDSYRPENRVAPGHFRTRRDDDIIGTAIRADFIFGGFGD